MKTIRLLSLILASLLSLIATGEGALAQQGKSGIERMYVLYCGDIALNDAGRFSPGQSGPGALAVTCYLVKHAQGWLLFDTGLGDAIAGIPDGQRSGAGVWHVKKTLASQLAEINVKPADIRYLVLSHSHPDHVGNLGMFKDATLVVQKAEYDWPGPNNTPRFNPAQKSLTPDGDYDVFGDGSVMLIATPGHSPGHQCLLVRLPQTGTIMLSGDAVHSQANWDLKRAPEQNFNHAQSLVTLERMDALLKQYDGELWIGHEPSEVAKRRYAPAFYE